MDPDEVAHQTAHISESKAPAILAANAACLIIAYLGLTLRLLARKLTGSHLGTDDWLTVLALVMYTATAIDGFICISLGAGRHEMAIVEKRSAFAKASFAFIVFYRPAIALVKFSVLFLYRRIFPQSRFRTVLTYYGIFVTIYTLIFLILDIFHCRLVSSAWAVDKGSSCLNMDTIWIVGGALNCVTDFAALCLPLPLLWQLHVTKDKRIQLMGVFLLGGFVCIVSIIRVIELAKVQSSPDESFDYSTAIIWSTVEVGVGIFCACLPVMRPIIKLFADYMPTMEAKSSGPASGSFQKQSHATNFRMKSYRNSGRLADVEDHEPFTNANRQASVSVTGTNSMSRDLDVESGYGTRSIAVSTKIEQKAVNDRPR